MKTIQTSPILMLVMMLALPLHNIAQNDTLRVNQPTEPKMNDLRFGVFELMANTFYVSYERFISQNQSIAFSGGFTYMQNTGEEVTGGIGNISYRYYAIPPHNTNNNSHKIGSYFGTYFNINRSIEKQTYYYNIWPEETEKIHTQHFTSMGGGAVFGVKAIFYENYTLDLFFGGGIRVVSNKSNTLGTPKYAFFYGPENSGIMPKAGASFGFNF